VAGLVADRGTGRTIGIPEPADAGPPERGVDRRSRMAGQGRQAVGAPAALDPGGEDRLGLLEREGPRRTTRPGAPVKEARLTLGPVAADPLVGRRPADALHGRGLGDRPAEGLDPADQELPAEDRQLRARMCHESLLSVRSVNTPYRSGRLSFVNNLSGNHN
jgi:hypothetical protein